ncbi:hypothetical protein HanXRQr2_Chr02g0070731 [Helianthus annuus]|uniref:Uncharacterized protein n=1 Tax=Helianthus annuus TaxID=4232 RepID=A0A9K3JQP8_HELAN|nr:hypothetical protein HanXRQr2_Chr02g0070731 [Helianthus annuus]KAJ0952140.1 hypothetical protein HanPSC8_Chr02g0068611 [Helianthus annuus]
MNTMSILESNSRSQINGQIRRRKKMKRFMRLFPYRVQKNTRNRMLCRQPFDPTCSNLLHLFPVFKIPDILRTYMIHRVHKQTRGPPSQRKKRIFRRVASLLIRILDLRSNRKSRSEKTARDPDPVFDIRVFDVFKRCGKKRRVEKIRIKKDPGFRHSFSRK